VRRGCNYKKEAMEMSDWIEVVPIIGVKIPFEEFSFEESEDGLGEFMAGVDERSKKFKGYYLGKQLCEMAFPEEFSAAFDVEEIRKTREFVRNALKKRGIDKEPEFLLVEYMG